MGELRSFVVRVLGTTTIGNRVNGVVEVVESGVRHPFHQCGGVVGNRGQRPGIHSCE